VHSPSLIERIENRRRGGTKRRKTRRKKTRKSRRKSKKEIIGNMYMDKKMMVMYLGYLALILIGIYFTAGFLKISGEGLAGLGYDNPVVDAMTSFDV